MLDQLSRLIDWLSEKLATRKGLIPFIGLLLIVINFILRLVAPGTWLVTTDLCLHLGLVVAIFGLMLAWAL